MRARITCNGRQRQPRDLCCRHAHVARPAPRTPVLAAPNFELPDLKIFQPRSPMSVRPYMFRFMPRCLNADSTTSVRPRTDGQNAYNMEWVPCPKKAPVTFSWGPPRIVPNPKF